MALMPAYAIDGGRVPASMLRMVAWVATSGASGVVAPSDFKVQALTTPGGAVSINAGGAVIPTRYGNSTAQQSYVVANDQAFNLTITAAGAAGRTEYVILRISDPQYSGQTPPDPQNALYVEVVTVSSLPTTYPYLALARLVLPANAATITDAMITDMRNVAVPRRERDTVITNATDGQLHNLNFSSFNDYPNGTALTVQIPSWASKAIVRADLLETIVATANSDGEMVLMLGGLPAYTTGRRYDEVYTGNTFRTDHSIVAAFNIPENMRGGSYPLRIRARRKNGTGVIRADGNTSVVWDIEYIEAAD